MVDWSRDHLYLGHDLPGSGLPELNVPGAERLLTAAVIPAASRVVPRSIPGPIASRNGVFGTGDTVSGA